MRTLDVATGLLASVTATAFGVGRHLDERSRRAYRAGIAQGLGSFHDYMRDARVSDPVYHEIARAMAGPFQRLPLLTIFGEHNDPLGFQPQWRRRFPNARQIVIPKGNHFPMCDAPDVVAAEISAWHRECVAGEKGQQS